MKSEIEVKLNQTLLVDPIYQQLLSDCLEAEANYLRILDMLSPEAQESIERYISFCQEMEYRKLSLLLEIAITR